MKKIFIMFIVISIMTINSCVDCAECRNTINDDSDANEDALRLDVTTSNEDIPCLDAITGNDDNYDDGLPVSVSIIRLLANPAEYHGKRVRVDGIVDLAVGRTSLFISREHWCCFSAHNALWLEMEQELIISGHVLEEHWYYINGEWILYEDVQHLNGRNVTIEGVFDMYHVGNRGWYSGGIVNITRVLDNSMFCRGRLAEGECFGSAR